MSLDIDKAVAALRAWVFERDFSHLTPELLTSLRLDSWCYPLLREQTPYTEAAYRSASSADLKQHSMLKQIGSLFTQNQLRWCPIKGADLAWRVWPDKILRTQCDLDILIHPDDRLNALDVLRKGGWNTEYHYKNSHHEAMMKRHGVALELHFKFPEFGDVDMKKLWESFIAVGNGEYRLPLELNLLMLFAHSRGHHWHNGIQLLLDCGFLLQCEGIPDWEKINAFAQFGHTASPAMLFCAFTDYFPKESIPEGNFSQKEIAVFRELVFAPPLQNSKEEIIMAAGNRFALDWWHKRLKGMAPSSIRYQTGNPQGHYFRLLIGYWKVTLTKIRNFVRYRSGSADPQLLSRIQNEEFIESKLKNFPQGENLDTNRTVFLPDEKDK